METSAIISQATTERKKRDSEITKMYSELMSNPSSQKTAVRKYLSEKFKVSEATIRQAILRTLAGHYFL